MTAYAEVIGDPIAQSKSPAIHNYWLRKLGLEAEYRACHVAAEGLAGYLAGRRDDPEWRGCNVTMPHKQAIVPLLDRLEIGAEMVGAVNTVTRRRNGALIGCNTDGAGFLEPLRSELAQTHLFRMARVLGTGGAARAIVAALAEQGFVIVLAGRDRAKARALLMDIDPEREHHAVDFAHFAELSDFPFDDREGCLDLIVNASPLGMAGQPPLKFDFGHAPPNSVVYDIVTHPVETEFLKTALAAGFRTIDGLAMLIGQAAVAFEKFFGGPPPRDDGDGELRRILTS
ncbi:MAG TPA: shikimate dehydrogenase [Croceibacterium sp.]